MAGLAVFQARTKPSSGTCTQRRRITASQPVERGLALPLLQRRFSPFWASLILGVVWAIWHAPAFLLSGTPQSAWPFGSFFFVIAAAVVVVWLNRRQMFQHGSGITEVLSSEEKDQLFQQSERPS